MGKTQLSRRIPMEYSLESVLSRVRLFTYKFTDTNRTLEFMNSNAGVYIIRYHE